MSDDLCIGHGCNHHSDMHVASGCYGAGAHYEMDADGGGAVEVPECSCERFRDGGDQEMPYEERESVQSQYERSNAEHVRLHS